MTDCKADQVKTIKQTVYCLVLSAGFLVGSLAGAQAPFEITEVADNLYRVANNSHRTVFLVTEEGVILADPINTEVATWLKGEIDERFGLPVRYVLYSHHQWDHASGGAVFADTATFVAHEEMARLLADSLPSNATLIDSNGNGHLERSEAAGGYAAAFDRLDRNGDDMLSGAEINVDIVPPTLLYSERMKLTLGSETVELIHTTPAHTADLSIMYFPRQRTGFGGDVINVRRLPGSFVPFDAYAQAIGAMLVLDIDIVVPGHGNVGTREHLAEYMGFLRHVQAEVSAGIARGLSLEQIQRTVDLSDYEDWLRFDTRRDILIANAYAYLRQVR